MKIIVLLLLVAQPVSAAVSIGTNALITRYDNDNYASVVNYNPGNGATVNLNPPRFHWVYSPSVSNENNEIIYTYQFQCAYDSSFTAPVVDLRTPLNFYNYVDHFTNSPVYWRIGFIAATNVNLTNWTSARSFTISPTAVVWDRAVFANTSFMNARGAHPHLGFTLTNREACSNYLFVNKSAFMENQIDVVHGYTNQWWWTNISLLETNYYLWRNGPYYQADAAKYNTIANKTLSGLSTNGLDFNLYDGIQDLVDGDQILVRTQTDPKDNGVYLAHSGAWTRTPTFDASNELTNGVTIKVLHASQNQVWVKNVGGSLGSDILWTNTMTPDDAYGELYQFVNACATAGFQWQMRRESGVTNWIATNMVYLSELIQSNGWCELDAYGNVSQINFPLAYAYDWCYDLLSTDERAIVLGTLTRFCDWERTNLFLYYWNGSSSVAGGGIMGKKIASHTWASQLMTANIALAAFSDNTNMREFFDLNFNYLLGVGLPFCDEDGPDRGRSYGSGDLPIWIESVSHAYEVFGDKGMTNFPGINGLADWMVYFWPIGYRKYGDDTWGDGGWGYPYLNQQTDAVKVWIYGDLLARMSGNPAAQMSYERATALWPFRNVVDSYASVTFNFNYQNIPSPTEQTNRSRIFTNGGWVFGTSRNPNDFGAYSNGVGFIMAARPSGGDNNHTKAADLDIELWAYGVPVTEGGGYYSSQWNSLGGLSRNTCMVNESYQLSDSWPNQPVKARFIAYQKGTDYVYVAADATGNYLYTDNVLKAQRHVLFVRDKYLVIYDDLASRTNSTFTWNWHIRPDTLSNLTTTSFNYTWTNLTVGASNVTTYVSHIGFTNLLGAKDMARGSNWTDPVYGTFYNNVTTDPWTGVAYVNGGMPDVRAHALYFTNSTPTTNWHFMTVIVPQQPGVAAPEILRLDDYTVTVTYDGPPETITVGTNYGGAYDIRVELAETSPPPSPPTGSNVWYAAADGTSTNGTSALPWSISYAVTNAAANPHLQPGDTVIFKPGTFTCTEAADADTNHYANQIFFRRAGGVGSKITYKSERLWGFTFQGQPMILNAASNLVISGFRMTWPGFTNRNVTNYQTVCGGPDIHAPNVDFVHNLIENIGHAGIGSWSDTLGKNISGNIIRFVGFNDYSANAGNLGTPAGSGMYLQNAENSAEALIRGNISYFNYTTGMKAYGNSNIYGFTFTNNIVTEVAEGGIFYHQDQTDSQGFRMGANYVWSGGDAGLRIGYQLGNANPSNGVIVGNYVVQTNQNAVLAVEDGWANLTVRSNTFVSENYRGLVSLEVEGKQTNFLTSHMWDRNAYFVGTDISYGAPSFSVGSNTTLSLYFQQWTNVIQGDVNSTIVTAAPPALVSYVFAPSSDTNFVHVAVFNWPTNTTTTVNLSAYFPPNAGLEVYDAQDVPNAYAHLVFNGSTISLDLTRTNRATMLGTFNNRTWEGFDPRFRAFVVHLEAYPYPSGQSNFINNALIINGRILAQ